MLAIEIMMQESTATKAQYQERLQSVDRQAGIIDEAFLRSVDRAGGNVLVRDIGVALRTVREISSDIVVTTGTSRCSVPEAIAQCEARIGAATETMSAIQEGTPLNLKKAHTGQQDGQEEL